MEELSRKLGKAEEEIYSPTGQKLLGRLNWSLPKVLHNALYADLISIVNAHPELEDGYHMLYLLSLEHWYKLLPDNIKELVDNREILKYDVILE